MSRQCEICGKQRMMGNKVSHAHNKTRREFRANLFRVHAVINGSPTHVKVCSRCLRSGKIQKA